jgi:hypothetical protein
MTKPASVILLDLINKIFFLFLEDFFLNKYFRCLKFNGLTIQRMMKEKFEKEGLSTIRDSFTYRNLCGKQVRSRGGGGLKVPKCEIFPSLRFS